MSFLFGGFLIHVVIRRRWPTRCTTEWPCCSSPWSRWAGSRRPTVSPGARGLTATSSATGRQLNWNPWSRWAGYAGLPSLQAPGGRQLRHLLQVGNSTKAPDYSEPGYAGLPSLQTSGGRQLRHLLQVGNSTQVPDHGEPGHACLPSLQASGGRQLRHLLQRTQLRPLIMVSRVTPPTVSSGASLPIADIYVIYKSYWRQVN